MNRKELLDAINKIEPALSDGKLIEFKGMIIFDGEKMLSYGDDISVSVPFKTDFEAAIKAEEFQNLIKKLADVEVLLTVKDNQLIVEAGKTIAGFSLIGYNSEDVPDLGLAQASEWNKFPESFLSDLKFCVFSASSDDAYGVLCNLNVKKDKIISSDNYRLTEKKLTTEMDGIKDSLLIPRKVSSFLASFSLVEYAITDACAHYRDANGVVFTHRLVADVYPNVEAVFDIEGKEIVLPKELAGALTRAHAVLSKDEDKATIEIKEGSIKVTTEGVGKWFEEKIDHPHKEHLKFNVNPEYMAQILEFSTNSVVGENALMFHAPGFRHLVCLIGE